MSERIEYRRQLSQEEAPKRALSRVFRSQVGAGADVTTRTAHEARFTGFTQAALIFKWYPEFFAQYADKLVFLDDEAQKEAAHLFVTSFKYYLAEEMTRG